MVYLKIYMQVNVQIWSVKLPDSYVYACVATTQMSIENLYHFRKFSLILIAFSFPSQGKHLKWSQQD